MRGRIAAIGFACATTMMMADGHIRGVELDAPPIAQKKEAVEILRVWADGESLQVALEPTYDDPFTWGILMADIARHASKAYAHVHDRDEKKVFARIIEGYEAEMKSPTDEPERIDPE